MQRISLGPVLAEVCRKWGIESVSLLGSALRDDFSPQSDVDLLIEYFPGVRHSLFQYGYMNDDFERVFGRKVDLVRAAGLRTSRNDIRKYNIFSIERPLYVANA